MEIFFSGGILGTSPSVSSRKEMLIKLGQGWEYVEKFTRLRWRCLGWPVGLWELWMAGALADGGNHLQ